MAVLIFCVLVWYATIAVFTFPWVLFIPEVAFGILLWRVGAVENRVVSPRSTIFRASEIMRGETS
jgi:hypothetical protein